ncbi:proline reductase cluster protein PrdD [Psychrilyobacter sp.]|uniref:proline reductase cluster protein PrdD n=1 Tax=Psychrilyobacter sp. TaxID=2586924 RepID=UPI003019D547
MKSLKRRKLQIKAFHIERVVSSETTSISGNTLSLGTDMKNPELISRLKYVKELRIELIKPNERDKFVNSIVDFIPISTKVLGKMGEGITHTLTGVNVMLTAIDEDNIQAAEFGSSEGILSEQVVFGRAGTPQKEDLIIHMDVILVSGGTKIRGGINQCHEICDYFIQQIREKLKKLNGRNCTDKCEFFDKIRPEGKKVVILKQVAGQGAMYDTRIFSAEPSGFSGGKSIIDLGNMPVLITPNEYRDGAIRAMH